MIVNLKTFKSFILWPRRVTIYLYIFICIFAQTEQFKFQFNPIQSKYQSTAILLYIIGALEHCNSRCFAFTDENSEFLR